MNTCIFCSIIQGKIPSTKIAESQDLLVIKDIAPKASIHYLIIPKVHVADIQSCNEQQLKIAGNMLVVAKELGKQLQSPGAFRLVINSGAQAGQQVFHMHMHFLAGKTLPSF